MILTPMKLALRLLQSAAVRYEADRISKGGRSIDPPILPQRRDIFGADGELGGGGF
jgi:hypothetical protein